MISAEELGSDKDLALEVLATARTIAPIDVDLEPTSRETVLAILRRVARDVATRGSGQIKAQRMGPASVDYKDTETWFSEDRKTVLRAICGVAAAASHAPIGSFPTGGVVNRMWPERYDE